MNHAIAAARVMRNANGKQQPAIFPSFLWRPARVRGIPILRESLPFADESPLARFHDHEPPNVLLRFAMFSNSMLKKSPSRDRSREGPARSGDTEVATI